MITTIKEFKKINENIISPSIIPNTISLWHGGDLSNIDDRSHKRGQWEFGPGLYLTSSYDVVQKYSRGSRKLYLVTVEKGVNLTDVDLSYETILTFINSVVIKSKIKDVLAALDRIKERMNTDTINAETFMNVIINNNAIKNTDTIKLKQFFVKNGIDYLIVDNAFGWHEKMIVLYNNDKIVDIQQIKPKDKIETYDLPKNFN